MQAQIPIMQRYRVRWHAFRVGGFITERAAWQYVDRVCMVAAPDIEYMVEPE